MEIAFSASFKKAFRKNVKHNKILEQKFWTKTEEFISNPFSQSLKTHKLTGKLKEFWSFSIEQDCRVIFYFEKETKAVFIDFGKHDEVY